MTDYQQIRLDITPCDENITDLFAAFLADCGYESFVPDETGLTAYINSTLFNKEDVESIIADFPMEVDAKLTVDFIEGKDWNEEWEKNYFQPIVIADQCVIHSTFHKDVPNAKYDIVIDPKMAFGTGHHSTTSLILQTLLETDMKGKSVIDMGTGTGILAILSAMLGAEKVTGIEIDPGAYENALEHVELNNVNVDVLLGDASRLNELQPADIFIANINRNIILADISSYRKNLKPGGIMLLSGFYESDIAMIERAANALGLEVVSYKEDKDWVAVKLICKK
ncbi:MAG: 50S ribosomal protein L11 methyltransferase [Muribaculaceae bacterium]|nr:50S ribosomal protein L11 methyltransferase [Bacteroidales bacterium]MBQ1267883.1 50S ribosomal protein L11 methyltransferase [Muribaculaceae bacterium]